LSGGGDTGRVEDIFQTLEDAQAFQKSVPDGMIAVVASM